MKRRRFTPEQKTKMVLEVLKEDRTVNEIAGEYGVHPAQLQRWKTEALEKMPQLFSKESAEADKMKKQHQQEKEELNQKIGQLFMEVDWLKKNLASSNNLAERKALVNPDDERFSIKKQLSLLGVNRSSYYYRAAGPSEFEIAVKHQIDRIFTKWPCFGYRRLTAVLKGRGYPVNRKRIQRYMREMGINAIYPGPNLSKRNRQHQVFPYLLKKVPIIQPDQVWGVDITYIPMKQGWMYLFVILDWYSRLVVGWELSNSLDSAFVIRGMQKALVGRKPNIINSDQGSQFTSQAYLDLMQSHGVQISMDGKGRATDNARTERFFRSLKYEKLYINEYASVREIRQAIAEYIEEYNRERPHQALDSQVPVIVYRGAA